MTDQIKITEQNGVLTLELNRPDLRNAISDEMIETIVATCDRINHDMSIGCMVITGAGDGFCSGGDLTDMVKRTGHFAGPPFHARRVYLHGIQQIPLALYNCQVPTIAAVNGSAVGAGCDLALMCDLRIASEKASFAESFLRVGLISGDGGAWFLPRRVGLAKACRMTYTGEFVKPDRALEWGLVEEVVPHEQLMERALTLATQIAAQPPQALRMTKQLLRRSLDMTLPDSLELAAAMQAISLETKDHREAFTAFRKAQAEFHRKLIGIFEPQAEAMFSAPTIETTIFARLPEKYHLTGRQTPWLKLQRRGDNLHSFLEGPSFDRDGNLYVVDVPFGRIFRISPSGIFDLVTEYDGEPNGLKIHRDGRIFVADHKLGILLLDPGRGAVSPVVGRSEIDDFRGPNDLVFASNGDLYFTDQGQTGLQDPNGRVFRLSTGGKLEKLLDGIPSPNGILLDAKETTVFVAVTRSNCIWRAPMLLDGTVSKVGIFIQMTGGVGPDGMAMDEDGSLAVCHPGMGATWLFSAAGEPLYRIKSCADNFPTNCAYGGDDRKSLFIVESHSGAILRAEMPTPGRKMFSHM